MAPGTARVDELAGGVTVVRRRRGNGRWGRRGILLLLALVIVVGVAIGAYTQASAFSYADLLSALRARGATVQESGSASSILFAGKGRGLVVDGAALAVYEYSATWEAQLDASRISADGATARRGFGPFGGSAVTVEWIAPPHHFRRGRVIVTAIGSDASILSLLTSILGKQFAGAGAPPGLGLSRVAVPQRLVNAPGQCASPTGAGVRRRGIGETVASGAESIVSPSQGHGQVLPKRTALV